MALNVDSLRASSEAPQPQLPASSKTGRRTLRDMILPALSLAVGFVVTAVFVHLCVREPFHLYAEMRSEKLLMLEEWTGRASSAAFGSSHVDNGFDPRVFDSELLDTSAATKTINLGISGGAQTEQAAVLAAFIDTLSDPTPNSPPRFALLEITASANFTKEHLFHPRAINIYDLRTVELALNFAELDRIGIRRAIGRSSFALVAGLLHYLNVGMLSSMIFAAPPNPQLIANQTMDDRRGLTPIQMAPQDSPEWIEDQRILKVDRDPRPKPGEIVEGHFVLLEGVAAKARQKHVRFVYFVAPRLDNLDSYPEYPPTIPGPLGPVLILNVGIPSAHPELYRADMWHDPTHLTGAGAALFSKLLAEDLKAKTYPTTGIGASRSEIVIR